MIFGASGRVRVFVYREPVDMRKAYDTLSALVTGPMKKSLLSGGGDPSADELAARAAAADAQAAAGDRARATPWRWRRRSPGTAMPWHGRRNAGFANTSAGGSKPWLSRR